jgi:hypothetical protein
MFMEPVEEGQQFVMKVVNLVDCPHSTGTYLLLGTLFLI